MTPKEKLDRIVHAEIRRCIIDLGQADEYFENSQYEGYEKNLRDTINNLSNLIDKTASKID